MLGIVAVIWYIFSEEPMLTISNWGIRDGVLNKTKVSLVKK